MSDRNHSSQWDSATLFVKCDVTQWKDQLALFKDAIAKSPSKRVDIAIANAGITGKDDIFFQNSKYFQEDVVAGRSLAQPIWRILKSQTSK
jgi:NAD(P)-dependent dehydrogenase (short-subunit alcohol dehydrogenase family)